MKTFKFADLPSESLASSIKVGSEVLLIDGSYAMRIHQGKLKECQGIYYRNKDDGEILTVIAINVQCPNERTYNSTILLGYSNNCILQHPSGDIIFCSRVNIRNIKSITQ
jgi:hypothetical protein